MGPGTRTPTSIKTGIGQQVVSGPPANDIRRSKENNKAEPLDIVFPSDLNDAHYMMFTWYPSKYQRGSFFRKTNAKNIIKLPVPQNLVDTLNAQYNDIEMGALGGKAVETISNWNKGNIGEEIAGVANEVGGAIWNSGKMVGATIVGRQNFEKLINDTQVNEGAGAVLNTFRTQQNAVGVGLNRFFGGAPNPYVTAMFRGVGLKTHNFTWKLAPASFTESQTLQELIRTFKAHMLPARSKQGVNLEFPDDCMISIGSSDPLNDMYVFKLAVLRNISINYAPDGTPSFFAGVGHPSAVSITLDFQETQIHTVDDYGGSEGGSVHKAEEIMAGL